MRRKQLIINFRSNKSSGSEQLGTGNFTCWRVAKRLLEWKTANIIWIHKRVLHQLINYRPISHAIVPCKTFTHYLNQFLGKSKMVDSTSYAHIFALDFLKAFNKVPRSLFLHKLHEIRIEPGIVTWIYPGVCSSKCPGMYIFFPSVLRSSWCYLVLIIYILTILLYHSSVMLGKM